MPESLTVEIRNTDEWLPDDVGVALCKALPFCQQLCAFCSILSLLAIALDRYFAICLSTQEDHVTEALQGYYFVYVADSFNFECTNVCCKQRSENRGRLHSMR